MKQNTDSVDQQHFVAGRIIRQHGNSVSALEDLARQRRTPAALEQAVAQGEDVEIEVPVVAVGLVQHLDIMFCEF